MRIFEKKIKKKYLQFIPLYLLKFYSNKFVKKFENYLILNF